MAANGDVANKIGTYSLALAARRAGIPFVVAAPESTIDEATASGADIPIELRADEEVTSFRACRPRPTGTRALNYAFDVTPADLVTAIVTEDRVIFPENRPAVKSVAARSAGTHTRPTEGALLMLAEQGLLAATTDTMMALRAHARGGPEQLVYEAAPVPVRSPGEALVAVHAAAITFAELSWDESWTTRDGRDRTPVIPSHEVSGRSPRSAPAPMA